MSVLAAVDVVVVAAVAAAAWVAAAGSFGNCCHLRSWVEMPCLASLDSSFRRASKHLVGRVAVGEVGAESA